MGRPKASESRDTRREILEAALELFAENGFHGTGLRDIARAVGVRESALYHHFPSKEALFDAVLADGAEEKGPLAPLLEGPSPEDLRGAFERLLLELLERFSTLRERKRFALLMLDGARLAREGGADFLDRAGGLPRAELVAFMTRLVRESRLRGDPEMLAVGFLGTCVLWRHLLTVTPGHRFVTDYRAFAKAHAGQFLGGALYRDTGRRQNDRSVSPPPVRAEPPPPEPPNRTPRRAGRRG